VRLRRTPWGKCREKERGLGRRRSRGRVRSRGRGSWAGASEAGPAAKTAAGGRSSRTSAFQGRETRVWDSSRDRASGRGEQRGLKQRLGTDQRQRRPLPLAPATASAYAARLAAVIPGPAPG